MDERIELRQMEVEPSHWWYCGKRGLIDSLFKRSIKRNYSSLKVLEIGCSAGRNLSIFSETNEKYGIDISKRAIRIGKALGFGKLICGDARCIPFKDEEFDLVIVLDILEHIENDNRCLLEIHRVLEKQGKLIVTVPALHSLWSIQDKLLNHHRRYEESELVEKLRSAGFQIEISSYWNFILFLPTFYAKKKINRRGNKDSSLDYLNVPIRPLNLLLTGILYFENYLIAHRFRMPIGVSIVCIGTKPAK